MNRAKKEKQKLLILISPPAGGKTTFRTQFLAENKNYVAVSRDDLRYMLRNEGWLAGNLEGIITETVEQLVTDALTEGKSVIADATHCTMQAVTGYNKLLKKFPDVKVEYKVFDITLEEAIERDSKRERKVGKEVLVKMFENFENLKNNKDFKKLLVNHEPDPVVQDETLPKAVICDLDGTLALFGDRRSPFDASNCHEVDELNVPVAYALKGFIAEGVKVLFVSGREDKDFYSTDTFLHNHFPGLDYELHMRSTEKEKGVKDTVVKHRIFKEDILPRYNTLAAFDDRNQILRLWWALGIFTFDVNNNAGEF